MRAIDPLLKFLKEMDDLSDVEKEILKFRIEQQPTQPEIDEARLRLSPQGNTGAWVDVIHPPKY